MGHSLLGWRGRRRVWEWMRGQGCGTGCGSGDVDVDEAVCEGGVGREEEEEEEGEEGSGGDVEAVELLELLAGLERETALLVLLCVERCAVEISDVATRLRGRTGDMCGVCGDSMHSRRRRAVSMVACIAAMLRRILSASDCGEAADSVDVDVGALVMRRIGGESEMVSATSSVALSE